MSIRERKFRPMLGYQDVPSDAYLENLFNQGHWFYVFDKYDGIRCLKIGEYYDHVVSRALKPIPNHHIRKVVCHFAPLFSDGELILGPNAGFFDVSSGIMSRNGQPDFRFMVFDKFEHSELPFMERRTMLEAEWGKQSDQPVDPYIQLAPCQIVSDFATLQKVEEESLDRGMEGLILRSPYQRYKYGRSTLYEAGMLKIKRFIDDEAIIIGFEEKMLNHNDPQINALGLQERKHGIDGKVPADTLGAFVCWHEKFGTFNIGTGWPHRYGKYVWEHQSEFLNKYLTFTYQPHGIKEKPRCPRFKAIRLD